MLFGNAAKGVSHIAFGGGKMESPPAAGDGAFGPQGISGADGMTEFYLIQAGEGMFGLIKK